MPEKPTLGVLVLSGVRHAASYLPMLNAQTELVLKGLCEEPEAPEWARRDTEMLANRFNLPFLADPAAALARDDIDLVVVCAEPTRHARLAVMALEAGKHVLIDKPMATNLPDATKVVRAAQAAGVKCTVINRLFNPSIQRARRWLDAGHIGLPRSLDVEFLANGALFAEAVERPEFVVNPALSGGGELRNFLGYPVDYLRYLTGLEVVEVYAEAGNLFMEPHLQAGVEDTAILSLRLEHEVIATVTLGRVRYAPTSGHTASTLRIIGSHGYLTVDEDQPHLEMWGENDTHRTRPIGYQNGVTTLIQAFVTDILKDRTPFYGSRDGWATVAAIDTAYRSLASGQPEAVPQLAAYHQA